MKISFAAGWGSMVALLVIMSLPFTFFLTYSGMKIEMTLLKKKVHRAAVKRDELARKNDSLRRALAEISGNRLESRYWKHYGALPFYMKNRVVNVRIAPSEINGQ